MALTDRPDTLAFHLSRSLTTYRDMSHVPCAAVAKALAKFEAEDPDSDTVPEAEAVSFYGMNHLVSLISASRALHEPLPKWELDVVMAYHKDMNQKAIRAFYYLLWICIREARHSNSIDNDVSTMVPLFGKEVAGFFESINGGETGISKKFVQHPPNATIGPFVQSLVWQFYKGKWSSGYGGKKWGVIADCLTRFVTGEATAEIMLDTIWTLSHNNGPVFNKGFCYGMYSAGDLLRILDIQRSGQIPEAVLSDPVVQKYVPSNMKALCQQAAGAHFKDKIGSYVDWMLVEARGSVNKYPKEIAAQKQKFGLSPAMKAQEEAAKKAASAAEHAAKAKALEHAKNWFEIMPGVEVKKIKLARAA